MSEEIFVKSIVEMQRASVYRIYRPLGLVVRGRLVKRQVLLCIPTSFDLGIVLFSGSSPADLELEDFGACAEFVLE